ncbi:hypothetical protein PIB30_050247 [Stylosanthes scabra]|uniref:Myb-like domain-containing protein n=1 Tax=Stylosanthes scabra TaxID=79078 RepID=A0ABU6RHR1_9FABA|nr:hypothetical protein [Stylosanthes scabra]
MFDGLPSSSDHFHQFIAPTTTTRTTTTATTTTTTTLPFHNHHHLSSSSSFSPLLHHASLTPTNTNTFLPFDPYNPHHHHHHHHNHIIPLLQQQEQPNATLSSLNNNNNILFQSATTDDVDERDQTQLLPNDLVDSSSWSNDEVVALLRIRSSMDSTWFPQLTYWDHVSRKLGELGFKKSGDKCKEKFEDETRYFNNYAKNNSYRFLNELEELYQADNHRNQSSIVENQDHVVTENTQDFEHPFNAGEEEEEEEEESSRDDKSVKEQCEEEEEDSKSEKKKMTRKRKKHCRFEMLKGFCESIVNNMMAQQEEIHNKLIQDMLRRDQEKLQREEEWKRQETERMNKELQIMAQEQAIAGDRQASIIEFLKKYTATTASPNDNPSSSGGDNNNLEPTPPSSSNLILPTHQIQNPSSIISDTLLQVPQVPSSSNNTTTSSSSLNLQDHIPPEQSNSISTVLVKPLHQKESNNNNNDVGRRWPRDEVMALINLRCESLNKMNNNNGSEEREIGNNNNKVPLWERISQGMSDLGYKRSAKRCKEKWENINKYFRKTKDVNKKRSIDSRTCPYFHQLKTLYDEGRLVHQPETTPEQVVPPVRSTHEKTLMQVPPLNFG